MPNRTQTEPVTVSEYAERIRRASRRAGAARIEGEVQRPRKTGGGAFMFDLTDGECRLPCKVLPWTLEAISHLPREGDLVRVAAEYPDFWTKGGAISVLAGEIELAGDGELLRRRRELIERLAREGLTDQSEFPALPRFPRAVGVIAGHGSSALHDVIACLAERFPVAGVITACCPVQGAGAPAAVIEALARLDLHPAVEVIIVARGGGSVQELAAFDDEGLCRAIRAIDTPAITAIGHTENSPVCNHVTHAAYVPLHAAERAVPDRGELLRDLDDAAAAAERGARRLRARIDELDARCRALTGSDRAKSARALIGERGRMIDGQTNLFLADHRERLSGARESLARSPAALRGSLAERRELLERFDERARGRQRMLSSEGERLRALAEQLRLCARRALAAHRRNYSRALDRHGGELAGGGRALRRAARELAERRESHLRGARAQARALSRRAEALIDLFHASDFPGRGWLRATDADGRAVTDYDQVRVGEAIRLLLAGGELDATVDGLHPYTEER